LWSPPWTEGPPPALTIGQTVATLWLAIPATAVAFTMFFGGLHRGVPAATASRLMLLGPVVAAILGWVVAHNTLSQLQITLEWLSCWQHNSPAPVPPSTDHPRPHLPSIPRSQAQGFLGAAECNTGSPRRPYTSPGR
jgi:hypothetical protein